MDDSLPEKLSQVVASRESRAARAHAATDLIRRNTPARWVGIYTIAGETVRNEGWSGPRAPAHPAFPISQGLTAHAISARSIALSNDVTRDPRYLANQEDSGSELIVPVLNSGQVAGTLDIESATTGAFDGPAITRYEALARALHPLWAARHS